MTPVMFPALPSQMYAAAAFDKPLLFAAIQALTSVAVAPLRMCSFLLAVAPYVRLAYQARILCACACCVYVIELVSGPHGTGTRRFVAWPHSSLSI